MKIFTTLGFLLFALSFSCRQVFAQPDLRVSDNQHYLVDRAGNPFYWIGDTGWAIFQRLDRRQVDDYLNTRKEQGFTVIQAVIFWYPHGPFRPLGPLNETNTYGHRPFVGEENDPQTSQPLIKEGGSPEAPNDYWDHADYVIEAAKVRGLKLVLLPCWANAFVNNRMDGSRIVFNEEQARIYGRFLGDRYQDQTHIIWCMGGDVDPVNFGDKDQRSVYRAMAEGIGQGVSGNADLQWNRVHPDWDKTLMTFHAVRTPALSGEGAEGGSSSVWFHDDPWLDFNMMETFRWMDKIYPYVREDYHKSPLKPTLLGEGAYESGKYKQDCHFITPLKVRRQGYHAFFAGSAGYTYGHWAVWPFRGTHCDLTWDSSLDSPGAQQVANVMHSFLRGFEVFHFVPDTTLIISDPGEGETQQCAMIKQDQSQMLVYFPERKAATIASDKLTNAMAKAIWFDPRTGDQQEAQIGEGSMFIPPQSWEDAILIIESSSD